MCIVSFSKSHKTVVNNLCIVLHKDIQTGKQIVVCNAMDAMMNEPLEITDLTIRKPAGATHFRNVYSRQERLLMNGCWLIASNYEFRRAEYEMHLNELRDFLGGNEQKNLSRTKDHIRGLVTRNVEWNSFRKDRTREWGVATFLSSGKIVGDKFKFRINPEFMSWAEDMSVWGRLKLVFQVNMTSRHAIALYEMLCGEIDSTYNSKVKEYYLDWSLDDLRALFNLGNHQYPSFASFKQHVVRKAAEEITLRTDLVVNFEGKKKKSRKFNFVRFHIIRKESNQLPLGLPDLNIGMVAEASMDIIGSQTEREAEVMDLLLSIGITQAKSSTMLADHSPERVRRNIAYAVHEHMSGKVTKLTGFLVKAIEEDYGEKYSAVRIMEILGRYHRLNEEKLALVESKRLAEELSAKKSDFAKHRRTVFQKVLASQSEEWVADQKALFEGNMPSLAQSSFENEAWDSPMVIALFNTQLQDVLLTEPQDTDFERFVEWQETQPVRSAAS